MACDEKLRFCELLSRKIKDANITQASFYAQLKIKKPYFYDILGGKVNPPPAEKQFAMVKILGLDKDERNLFFEIAARERREVPADIAKYLENEKNREELRKSINFESLIDDGLYDYYEGLKQEG